jgi:Cellulase (glycosyl hydrolase family 5)
MRCLVTRLIPVTLVVAPMLTLASAADFADDVKPWPVAKVKGWAREHPWLVGCNFSPSTAVNQLEMWQADTFDLPTIDRELGWAEGLGFNSIRVFLHHLPWERDSQAFLQRIEQFLASADRHKIGVMFVLLDGVWDPFPHSGKQYPPRPGLHNSGWVQSPGLVILQNPERHDELKGYIAGVVGHFRTDRRVHAWDLFNEPDNPNRSSYGRFEPANKAELALMLLKKELAWARSVDPHQPLTAGAWAGDLSSPDRLSPINRFMLEQSDVISFHNYKPLPEMKAEVECLKRYDRPILCSEYMARPAGSRFEPILAYLKSEHVGAYNWGFVAGKTQTIYPWDSWHKPYVDEPSVWFHDIFRPDGTPYNSTEVEYIRAVTGTRK